MYKCTDAESLYNDIPPCPGKVDLPGIRAKIYSISKRDIVLFPKLPASPETMAAVSVYQGDFGLAADKVWQQVGLIENQNSIKAESQGTYPSKTFKNTVEFLMPGTGEEVTGYVAQANNDDMIYLAIGRDGKARVIGNEAFMTELSITQDSGKSATDTNATTVQAVVTDVSPAPFYPGKIITSDGVFDGTTGLPVTAETGGA